MKFHIRRNKRTGEYAWRLKARNGKQPGEQWYTRRIDAVKSIQAVIKACVMADEESKLIVDE